MADHRLGLNLHAWHQPGCRVSFDTDTTDTKEKSSMTTPDAIPATTVQTTVQTTGRTQ